MEVRGGYTMAHDAGLGELNEKIAEQLAAGVDLKALLKIGVHADVEVTATRWGGQPVGRASFDQPPNGHRVTQVFGSACSVAARSCWTA